MTAQSLSQWLQEARRLDRAGQLGPALFAYKMVLRLDPQCRPAQIDLAGLLSSLGRHEEARALCLAVLAADPDQADARLNLASALLGLGAYAEAEAQYRALLASLPGLALAHFGLASSLGCQDRLEEARAAVERALALDPDHRPARDTHLRLLLQLKAWPEARAAWTRIAREHLDPFERWVEEAVVHLTFGDLERGWDLMEHRLDRPGFVEPVRAYAQPRWDGSPFPGRTLLLHWEQGSGDTIMFIRYATLAKALGGTVLALVPSGLVSLLATVPGLDGAFGPQDGLPPFDLQLSLFSLPRVFATRLDSIPTAIPYLRAPDPPPALAAALAGADPRVRIGLVWAGNPDHRSDALRSIPASALAPLADLPGIAWHSLQLGAPDGLPFPGIHDLQAVLPDFAATAWALQRMDLVITVDTAVAHLAGALGRPAWVLLPFVADWRWLLERSDSPWYPSLRLFRQERPFDWPAVVARVAAALLERGRGTC